MIRQTQGNPARRIAIIKMPRPQRARMGSIRAEPPPPIGWTTITDEAPDSSANWLSYVLMGQARTRENTPGTLTYTPASDTPGQNVAPWNNWLSPNCPPAAAAPDATAAASPDYSKLLIVFGLVGAAAAATYLVNSAGGRR